MFHKHATLDSGLLLFMSSLLYFVYLCICVYTCMYSTASERSEDNLSPSRMWVLGIKLWSLCLATMS